MIAFGLHDAARAVGHWVAGGKAHSERAEPVADDHRSLTVQKQVY